MASRILDAPWLDHFFLDIIYTKARAILKGTIHPDDDVSTYQHSNQVDNEDSEEPCEDELQWLERFWKKHSWQLLYPVLFVFYLRNSQAQTPAVRALGLQVVPKGQNKSSTKNYHHVSSESFLTRILCWAVMSGATPFLLESLRSWVKIRERRQQRLVSDTSSTAIISNTGTSPNSSTSLSRLGAERQLEFAKTILKTLDRLLPVAKLALLLRCWSAGSSSAAYLTTDPIMWACGLAYTDRQEESRSTSAIPKLQVGFAHRRFVWEEIIRTMRLWLMDGFSNWQVWKSHLRRACPKGAPASTNYDQCGLCKSEIVVIPMNVACCGQTYCYTCLDKLSSGRRGRFCLQCGYEPLSSRDAKRLC